jgi:phage tail-like protein
MTASESDTPVAASARGYLRGGLPAIYQETTDGSPPVVMGFLGALEQVLDPVVALLDNLAWHLRPLTAPEHLLGFLADLIGFPDDPTLGAAARRGLLANAGAGSSTRGTKAGLERALCIALPDLKPEVFDGGATTWAGQPAEAKSAHTRAFTVRVVRTPTPTQAAQIARCVEDHRPAGVVFHLRVARRADPA